MEPDFSGFATKAGLKCADGRTIMKDAFAHQDKMRVPLVWSHQHRDSEHILGHAILHAVDGDVRCDAFFNDTPKGQHAKKLVEHGDIQWLSIYANKLVEKANQVFHGAIREVSLVLAGANPGAKIDFVAVRHSDGEIEEFDDEAVIHTGIEIEVTHPDEDATVEHAEGDLTVDQAKAIYEALDEKEKEVVHYMIGEALEHADEEGDEQDAAEHSASGEQDNTNKDDEGDLAHQEGTNMNAFEQNGAGGGAGTELKHDQLQMNREHVRNIMTKLERSGSGSLKHAFNEYVDEYKLEHGIENLEVLFPDAKAVQNVPEWMKRQTEWVPVVLRGASHTPFAKVKSRYADITMEEARAKGYIKGTLKKEEWFSLAGRETGPTTIYKKQAMDRDDLIDITEFDVIVWLKGEMRLMLEEECARAILLGDGRESGDDDKVKEPAPGSESGNGIRSIANDHELYAPTVLVDFGLLDTSPEDLVDEVLLNRRFWKGTGRPTFFTTEEVLTKMLLAKDGQLRRLYASEAELAAAMRVSAIVPVEVMEEEAYSDIVGIMVNMVDYNIGTNRGGEVTLFDDFDIDYNKEKYLIETRFSGALVKLASALVFRKAAEGADLVEPVEPAFDGDTLTVPTVTGITYKNGAGTTLTTGAPVTVTDANSPYNVKAYADTGYYFTNNVEDEWTFTADDDA